MAAQLRGPDTEVKMVRGGLGELRVTVEGQDAYSGYRLLYPSAKTVVTAVKKWMAGRREGR
ncbi:MAG TPA: hypothetical protein VFG76_11170 [Candidatus Polarisedimenticolia bacterium]|nr:hypothetical protein [Candidatus Polarisedimenticolia bacterium]